MEATLALERARAAYEYGDMEMVVDSARIVAEGRSRPTPAQRVQALRFLGIGLYLTGRTEGAEAAFFDLAAPEARRQARSPPTPAPTSSPSSRACAPVTPSEIQQAAQTPGKHLLLAFLPPVGQFQNGDRARGVTLAARRGRLAGRRHRAPTPAQAWQKPRRPHLPRPRPTTPTPSRRSTTSRSASSSPPSSSASSTASPTSTDTDDEHPLAWLTPAASASASRLFAPPPSRPLDCARQNKAGSSVVERGLYTARVAGSIPVPPTKLECSAFFRSTSVAVSACPGARSVKLVNRRRSSQRSSGCAPA